MAAYPFQAVRTPRHRTCTPQAQLVGDRARGTRECRSAAVAPREEVRTMSTNLIAQIMNEFRGDTLNGVASALGETPAKTQAALGGVVPALIGGLAANASSDQGHSLFNIIKGNKLDSSSFTDIASAVKAP